MSIKDNNSILDVLSTSASTLLKALAAWLRKNNSTEVEDKVALVKLSVNTRIPSNNSPNQYLVSFP